MRAAGKSTIVTGAGNGIGEGIARRLAAEGARVIVNDIDATKGEAVAANIRASGGDAQFVQADMTNNADVLALVLRTQQLFGRLYSSITQGGHTATAPC